MNNFPMALTIGTAGSIEKMEAAEYDQDPRGILWMWKPPQKHRKYILGGDPTVGRTGWNRYNRSKEDSKTDNGALEIVMLGRRNQGFNEPDEQVAEYAAPIDAFELGYVANIMGRLYAGIDEDQCGVVLEEGFDTAPDERHQHADRQARRHAHREADRHRPDDNCRGG